MLKRAREQTRKSVIPVACDIISKGELQTAVSKIAAQTPFVNAVVANAGVSGPLLTFPPRPADASVADIYKQLWNLPAEETRNILDVNVLGSYDTFVAFMELMEAGNVHPESRGKQDFIQSQFITITSLASFSRKENVSHMYMASKAALLHLTKALATQFGPMGIRTNSIAPGLYLTEMTDVSKKQDFIVKCFC